MSRSKKQLPIEITFSQLWFGTFSIFALTFPIVFIAFLIVLTSLAVFAIYQVTGSFAIEKYAIPLIAFLILASFAINIALVTGWGVLSVLNRKHFHVAIFLVIVLCWQVIWYIYFVGVDALDISMTVAFVLIYVASAFVSRSTPIQKKRS